MRIVLVCIFLSIFVIMGTIAENQGNVFDVPIGTTDLLFSVNPAVGYQFDNKTPHSLGYGWSGVDKASGVYFQPEDSLDGVRQVFMHCPWVGGTGVTFADYTLKLPPTKRVIITFEIGIRMNFETASDGVIYRVIAGNKKVFETHCTWKGEFRSFQADLTEYAGKEFVLRLLVDPGPLRNAGMDWSLWKNVKIITGTDQELADAKSKAEAGYKKLRAEEIKRGEKLADTPLIALTSHRNDSICPGTLHPVKHEIKKESEVYAFYCRSTDEVIEYRFYPADGLLSGISVRVNGKLIEPVLFTGGPVVFLDKHDFKLPDSKIRIETVYVKLNDTRLDCTYRYINPETNSSAELSASLRPEGKSLGIELWGEPDRFSGFSLKTTGTKVNTAFVTGSGPVWRKEGVYGSAIVDVMKSDASGIEKDGSVVYSPLTSGKRNAMHDLFYITVTGRYEETFPAISHQPSPFLEDLSRLVVLDVWHGSFSGHQKWLEDMDAYGVNRFIVVNHVWQRDGYDRSYPDVLPANSALGGDDALCRLSRTARKIGHLFCVHENYFDYYPNAVSFRKEDRCLDPEGRPVPGWDNGTVRAVILKPSRLMDYVNKFSPEIKKRYECNAAYHDIMPNWNVDFDSGVYNAGKIRVTHEYAQQLCDFGRTLFKGPILFELTDPFMAGIYDGGCNYVLDMYRIPFSVAFELLKVHPKMSNHGFGYYERWLPWGYSRPEWNSYVMTDGELDKYRAYQAGFGRTGFIGQQLMKHPHGVVREYYLMQAFGRAYTGKLAIRIRYKMDGRWVDSGTAARHGELSRLNVEYEDGQQVYVNLSENHWQTAGHNLPQNGIITLGPRSEAWTALRDGQICDFSAYDNVIYADARSHYYLPMNQPQIEPSVGKFEYTGGKKFQLTLNWKIERRLEKDYTVFLHFTAGDAIKFQADHMPSKRTSQWEAGQIISDGPLSIEIKDEPGISCYEIITGLYDSQGRATLAGDLNTLRIGQLIIDRDGASVKTIKLEPVKDLSYQIDTEPYKKGANISKKVIDFGPVSTNGALIIRKMELNFEVIPVPAGESMTVGLPGPVRRAAAYSLDGKSLDDLKIQFSSGKSWFTIPEAAAKIECVR